MGECLTPTPRIRKMSDYYDFSIIPNYELALDYDSIDRLPIVGVVVQLAKVADDYVFVSIAMGEEYGLEALLDWLSFYQIDFFHTPRDVYQINNTSRIFETLHFEGCAIIYSQKDYSSFTVKHGELEDVFEHDPEREHFLYLNSYSEVDWSGN